MAYEPLHHKYRPQTFAQLVGQQAIATTLTNALTQQRIAPAYLFCGPRGTGKTSSARILAKSLNCIHHPGPSPEPCGTCDICRAIVDGSALDFLEIDAASNTGVDNIRELIERAQFAPVQCRYKVYVIDECHMLSTAAFNALLKTLEEPPERVVFVLATTDPQRVLPTIISRCQRFDYRRIPLEDMVAHLGQIAKTEDIYIEETALRLVAQVSQGGLRDAESLLDQLSLLEPPITAEKVWDLVGAVPERDLLDLVRAIAADNGPTLLDQARKLMDRGREPLIVLQNLAGFYRDLLIAKTASDRPDLVAVTPPTWEAMTEFVQTLDLGWILAGQQHLRTAEVQVKNTTQPRLWLEVTLMGLLPSTLAGQVTAFKPLPPAATQRQSPPPSSAPAVPSQPPTAPPPIVSSQPAATFSEPQAPPPPTAPPSSPPPPSSSSSPPPPSTSSPAPTPPTTDLPYLWQQVVAALQPLGTRALMQQQGNLLFFDGAIARIGINSRPLFKMAQGRIANVEAAFEKVLRQPVKVSLEVMPETESVADPVPPPIAVENPPPSAPPEVVPEPDMPLPSPPDPSPPAVPGPTPSPSLEASLPQPEAVPPHLPEIASDLERAVKSFAQFFNGQIINLDDDLGSRDSPSKNNHIPNGDPDRDVPF